MADQLFTVNSGFYNSVDQDRLYSADQMNMPYKRLVSNGIFATPEGTPSTDMQVTAAGGMTLQVAPGLGIIGDKWFEVPSAVTITIPGNTATVGRIDSVIARVDKNTASRSGSIVYRTGTASASPAAPALDTAAGVAEYRLANVAVAASATSITQANITDMRGSAECPWITALINQVDTSVLLAQYQAAYADFMAEMERRWTQYMEAAGGEYNLTMNLVKYESSYTTTSTTRHIPIQISQYRLQTDILLVFVNGIAAREDQYTKGSNYITLAQALPAGQKVDFIVLKSLINSNLDDALDMIDEVGARVPAAPITDGTYQLRATVTDGVASYAWVSVT